MPFGYRFGHRFAPLLLTGAVLACSATQRGAPVAARSIDDVLAAHADSLMAMPGVVGTAIGLCEPAAGAGSERCIKVMVRDAPALRGKIPTRLEGYRVVVEVTGTIRPR